MRFSSVFVASSSQTLPWEGNRLLVVERHLCCFFSLSVLVCLTSLIPDLEGWVFSACVASIYFTEPGGDSMSSAGNYDNQ